MRYSLIEGDKVVHVVNYDGKAKRDGDLRGPLPESEHTAREWVGRPAVDVDALGASPAAEIVSLAAGIAPAVHPLDHDGNGEKGGPVPPALGNEPMTAQQLLDASKGMPFFTLKAEAQRILGNDTPNRKADIIAALQRRTRRTWPPGATRRAAAATPRTRVPRAGTCATRRWCCTCRRSGG